MAVEKEIKLSDAVMNGNSGGLVERSRILDFEKALATVEGAMFGDNKEMPLKHSFAPGMYVREIFIPKGSMLTGKIHRHAHPNFLMKGEVIVVTEFGGREHLKAPASIISEVGTKRAIYALEDVIWVTVHLNPTNTFDLKEIEEYVIAPSYQDLLPTNDLENKNCLILALKKLGRNWKCLTELKAVDYLLPLKDAITVLYKNNISVDDLDATRNSEGVWHIEVKEGESLDSWIFGKDDLVGTWVAVGVGSASLIAGVGSQIYNSYNEPEGPKQVSLMRPYNEQDLRNMDTGLNNQFQRQNQFYDQLARQRGIENQSTVFNQQQALAKIFEAQMRGEGPNPAQAALAESTGRNVAQQNALMASGRGSSVNPALMARQSANIGSNVQQQSVGQAATLQAQQQIAAQEALQRQQGMMAGLSTQQVGQQMQALSQAVQAGLISREQALQAIAQYNAVNASQQGNANALNTQIGLSTSGANRNAMGGMLNGLGAAASMYAGSGNNSGLTSNDMFRAGQGGYVGGTGINNYRFSEGGIVPGGPRSGTARMLASGGGRVPGKAEVSGDSIKNDKVDAKLSPQEIVLPRSVTLAKNAPDKAAKFVAAILAKGKR